MSKANINIGQIRVNETDKGIVVAHHLTERERFLSEYTVFAVKTAKSSVEMCRVVYKAKTTLTKSEYQQFLRDIHHSSEDSTIRKWLAIGSHYDKLIQYTNLLPNSWTSIYEITQIPAETFDALVSTGSSMANLTGAQIKLLTGTNKKSDSTDSNAAANAPDTSSAAAANSTAAPTATGCTDVGTSAPDTSVANSTAATTTPSTTTSTAADLAHAQKATTSMLERVSATAVTEAIDDEPYEVVIRFNRKPSEAAIYAMVDAILNVKSKHHLDVEITSSRDCTTE